MSINSLNKNHLQFESNVKELIKYGMDIVTENINKTKNKDRKKEKTILVEALLLRSCAYWEKFLEKEIILLVNLNNDKFKIYFELPQKSTLNIKLIRAILYGNKYLDFHDIKNCKGFFSKLLTDNYNPFNSITIEQFNNISFSYTIRNYLSHYSDYSKKNLCRAYIDKFKYKIFQEPGLFLLKEKGKYFENLLHNFVLVSINMRSFLGGKNE